MTGVQTCALPIYRTKTDKGGIAFVHAVVAPGQTVLDVGAHKAAYSYTLLQCIGASGKLYAFEPQSNLYQYIQGLKQQFGWKNMTIEHLALSDQTGSVTLHIPTNTVKGGSSPGATIVEGYHADTAKTETVAMDTLDSYCEKHQIRPDFIKIDVEGNELKVFKGGVGVLQKYKPKILVEIEARHIGQAQVLETMRFLESLGYAGYCLQGFEHLPLSQFSFEHHQNQDDMKNYCNNFIFI